MEIEAKDGTTTIVLDQSSTTQFGRGRGFDTNDRTVSRRHVSFKPQSESSVVVRFEVIGKNPMWVRSVGEDGETQVFRKGDGGEMNCGDSFCVVSGKTPVWFGLKRKKNEENEVLERLETSSMNDVSVTSFEPVDVSDTDPVKEFGFLVMGHEFDRYSKRMICDIKNWDWFLEEARKDSDDEDFQEKKGRSVKKKRKNARGIDDDDDDNEWTGESEDDKELVSNPRKFQRPKYSTRSKDSGTKPYKNSKNSKDYVHRKSTCANEEDNEDEDTLGGFIVDDKDVEQEEESDVEEEFDEDDDDEDLND